MKLTPATQYENTFCKFLLYGDSGAGKTFAAASAGSKDMKIAILETEPNGLLSIRASNPNALVVEAKDVKTIGEFITAALNGSLKRDYGVEIVVFDSLTEIQRIMKDSIVGKGRMSLQHWGLLTDKMRSMMRSIREIPMHVVCTALSAVSNTEDGDRFVAPAFEGKKLANEVAQYFNAVGYVFKKQDQQTKNIVHSVMLSGPHTYMCKAVAPLQPIEGTNINDWILRCLANKSQPNSTRAASDPRSQKRRR